MLLKRYLSVLPEIIMILTNNNNSHCLCKDVCILFYREEKKSKVCFVILV